MKNRSGFFLSMLLVLVCFTSCEKKDSPLVLEQLPIDTIVFVIPERDPIVDVTPIISAAISRYISCTSVRVVFNVINYDGKDIVERGVYYGTTPNPTTNNTDNSMCFTETINSSLAIYRSEIDQLQPATLYYVRVFVTTKSGTYYSEDLICSTNPRPTIYTIEASEIKATIAKVNGNVTSTGNSFVVERGVCYSMYPDPVAFGDNPFIEQEVQSPAGAGEFTIDLTDLIPGNLYYARSFVGVATGNGYGDQLIEYGDIIKFTTKSSSSKF
jgi:hypothetical protein